LRTALPNLSSFVPEFWHQLVIPQVHEDSLFNRSGTLRDSLHAVFFWPHFFIIYERASRFSCHESKI